MHSGRWPVRAGGILSEALLRISAGCPSGGPFLVPPRKGERMRLKEALKGLLPQTNPSSLRILPARTWYREAGFRRFLRKHPRIQHIPCQCAHWRGIEDHFGFWNDCRWQSPPAAFCKIVLPHRREAIDKALKMGYSKDTKGAASRTAPPTSQRSNRDFGRVAVTSLYYSGEPD